MNIKDLHIIYFVGIGGIGMSALARYFNGRGIQVHGYDKVPSPLTQELEDEGMIIHYEDDTKFIPKKVDLVIYTPAIPKDHKELNWFMQSGIPLKKRAEVLGIISRNMKTVAVAGTHGKTTTSSIVTHLLRVGGVDCTAFLGGIAANFASNFVEGKGEWVVVEADEFDRSFWQLSPDIAAVLSIDPDHLDIYHDANSFSEGFHEYMRKTKANGRILYNKDTTLHFSEENDADTLAKMKGGTIGLHTGDHYATNFRISDGFVVFDYTDQKGTIEDIYFTQPGDHNIFNATMAIAIGRELGVTDRAIREAMRTFKGIQRRFEFIVRNEKQVYIDDYAHHPTELNAAIQAARFLYPTRKITGVFQPHLYTRTRDFVDGFANALDKLDEIVLLDIYPARELPIEGVSSAIIFDKMKNPNKQLISRSKTMETIEKLDIDVLLTLGAGDIDRFVEPIELFLNKK